MTPENYNKNSIKVLTTCDNAGYAPVIDPAYVVLGMLDEYMGRRDIQGEDRIESFYPAEHATAQLFIEYAKALARAENLPDDIKITTGPHGHLAVSSLEIAKFVRSLYGENYIKSFYDDAIFTDAKGEPFRTRTYGISEAMFPPLSHPVRVLLYRNESVDCRFSFLLGAYLRYGEGNRFKLANAGHKVDLIIAFLERLGAQWISRSWMIETVPRVTSIRFGADEVLARLFGIEPAGREAFRNL